MIRRVLGLAVLGGGLVLVACGDDEAPAAKFPTSDAFCTAKAAEECKAVAAACVIPDETCKSARTNACTSAASSATGQGRTYRAGNAEDCIAKTTAVYADRVIDAAKEKAFDEACGKVFTGSKKRNETCSNEFDCEAPFVCDLDKKLCAEKADRKLDDPCNNPGDICGAGLYCTLRGNSKFCVAKNKLGEACEIETAPCADGLRCNGAQCVALQAAAQPCDTNDECVTGFCNAEKKCQARQYASETGTCKDFGGT